ncbi:unnamed protein product [Pieris macdunnoughi]|uniref:Uncharacterized protein n=1 Tax=Pieris macdunnoughi TaxID=345717 RepID=A0A821QXT6_9NEOP|nr:unnamed protein product [Pieris macdunnoughi]
MMEQTLDSLIQMFEWFSLPSSNICSMYLPTLTHTQIYTHVFVRVTKPLAFMGIHLEDVGKGQRGSNEIASGLYKFFTFSEIGYTTDKKQLIFWSDNCGGQNKNQAVVLSTGITKTNSEKLQDMMETPVPLSAEKKKDIGAMPPYLAGDSKPR